jgi:hypothetical protein
VNTGDYGTFSEGAPPQISQRHVIRAAPGETPTLTGISISYSSLAEAKLTLGGFIVRGTAGRVVNISKAAGVHLRQLHVSAVKWAVGGAGVDGVVIQRSQDIVVEGTKVESVHRGMQVGDSDNTRIIGNYIVATGGSGIQYLGGNTFGEISYNHITGADYNSGDPDAVQSPHASIISFRSGDVIVRGNHMHGMGTSSGIMFYEPDVAGGEQAYDDILIENNAIYDVINVYAIRFYNLGSNVELRNNLIFPGIRTNETCGVYQTTNDARYRYNTALIVHNRVSGSSGIRLYDNIFVGTMNIAASNIEDEGNNFAWSWAGWVTSSPSGTSHIVTSAYQGCGQHNPMFEDGSFFSASLDPTFPGRGVYDFSLAAGSPGQGFGDLERIGSVDENGFVRTDGACASSN